MSTDFPKIHMREPKIISGARGNRTEDSPEEVARSRDAVPMPDVVPAAEGEVVFVARHPSYLLSLGSTRDTRDEFGNVIAGESWLLQFERNICRTTDQNLIKRARKSPSYGVLFWEWTKLQEKVREKKLEQADELVAELAKESPEVVTALMVKHGLLKAGATQTFGLQPRSKPRPVQAEDEAEENEDTEDEEPEEAPKPSVKHSKRGKPGKPGRR